MAKYIDADALIERINKKYTGNPALVSVDFTAKRIINSINKMSAADVEPVVRWISVDERLPEEPYSCLVVVEGTDRYTGEDYLTVFPVLVGYDGETWNDYDGQEIPVEVEAWLKVPEPPKMDGGSEE